MKACCKNLVSIYHPNGNNVDKHTHADHELVYCIEGGGSVSIDGKKSSFSVGNYYITHRGSYHTEQDKVQTRIIYFYFDAPPEMVKQGIYTDYDGSVLSAVKHMQKELEAHDIYRDEMIDSLITRMLIKSLRSAEGKPVSEGIQQAVRYVDENIQQDIDFKALARIQHYSFDRFRHVFKEYTGYSPHQYVIKGRIERAKFLLELNPYASLTEISYSCGFSSSSHFTKAFKSKTGITPSEYARTKAERDKI